MRGVEVDPEKDNIQKTLEGMAEVVLVDLDKVLELAQIETELDATNV